MKTPTKPSEGWSLDRWSRLKRGAARERDIPAAPPVEVAPPAIATTPTAAASAVSNARERPHAAARADVLPPVESLTIDSDFSAFLQPKVDEALKRQALKQLFRDPRFNVMDGLDVYVGDYSQPDPIDPDVVRQMVQGRYIFDPPPTRVNAQGFVEDVPPEEVAAAKAEASDAAAAQSTVAGDQVASLTPPPTSANEAPTEETATRESAAATPPSPAADGPSSQ